MCRLLHVVLLVLLIGIVYSTTSEDNGTYGYSVDGKELIELGRKYHKPVLTLIGLAIRNQQKTIENQQKTIHNLQETIHVHPCGEWTPWSPCDASKRGYFGSQTRNRSCVDTQNVDRKSMTTELDNKLCEGDLFCPVSYNLTDNGFCMKLNTTSVTNDVAVEQCKQEGGYLIHIDSKSKHDDLKSIIGGVSNKIHIDGRRKDSPSTWEYQYGSQSSVLKWHSGYPKDNAGKLCLVYVISTDTQYNSACSFTRSFMCEILNV